ncbi:MAG: DEAD/DEAH box helicase [Rickettsiales bacterium]
MHHAEFSSIADNIRRFVGRADAHVLYPVQQEMMLAVADRMDTGQPNGTLQAATGVGKTYAQAALAVASGENALIASPRNIIGGQAYGTLIDRKLFPQDVSHEVALYDGQQPKWAKWLALKKRILITTNQSFPNLVSSGAISPDPQHPNFRREIILDEAHRSTGPEFLATLEPFMENCHVTAWTATDTFYDGSTVNERIFHSGGERIFSLDMPEAVRRGYLVDAIHTIPVEVAVDPNQLWSLRDKFGDYDKEAIQKFVLREDVQRRAVDMYMNYEDPETHIRFRGLPCVVNTYGVAAAYDTAAKFNKELGPDSAVVVSGDTPRYALRNRNGTGILDRFDRGEIKVLCAADLLIEGFDSKNVSVVMSLRPSLAPWLVEQMLGRGARKPTDDYFERYGHDKQLFGVNFFERGTRPLLFSDVIQGKKINNENAYTREATPRSKTSGDEDDVKLLGGLIGDEEEVIEWDGSFSPSAWSQSRQITAEDVANIPTSATYHHTVRLSRSRRPLEEGELPNKTKNWLSLDEIRRMPGSGLNSPTELTVRKILSKFDTKIAELQTIEWNGQVFRVKQMQSGPNTPVCLRRKDMPLIAIAMDAEPGPDATCVHGGDDIVERGLSLGQQKMG